MTTKEQDALILSNLDYATKLARVRHSSTPCTVTLEDLEGTALLGLTQAARTYDPTRGTKFTTWAYYRILGAMVDELRSLDHAPQKLRTEANKDKTIKVKEIMLFEDLNTTEDNEEECHDPVDYREEDPSEGPARRDVIEKVRGELDPILWEIYFEHYAEGKPAAHIARERGVTRQCIAKRLAKAQRLITEIVGEEDE